MSSRPTTPSAEDLKDRKRWRFETISEPCEWAEEYIPGGLHPVDLGDSFHDGAYTVIRKLGQGSFSTVWLAVDTRTKRYVALKIMQAKASGTDLELRVLSHLSSHAAGDLNACHVTALLDHFIHRGPNGSHLCLALEPMGCTAASLVEELPENKPHMLGKPERYPKWMAKQMLLHALRGLAFLYANGVVHGDVQPGNLLFAMKDISTLPEDELRQRDGVIPLRRLDGKTDRWAPRNLYLKQSLHEYVELDPPKLHVKISDLGAAFFQADPPSDTVTPLGLRAPELILHQPPFGSSIDMWSFGCLLFEFLTGQPLFSVFKLGRGPQEDNDADDGHLIQLHDVLGPLPDNVMAAWPRAALWIAPDGGRLAPLGGESYVYPTLEALFAESKSDEITDEEAAVVCELIRHVLKFEPDQRPTAKELLEHPWFSGEILTDKNAPVVRLL